jgi:hypothetical protein
MIRYCALALLLAAGASQIVQSFGDRYGFDRAMAQAPTKKDVAPGQLTGLLVSERDYEVSLPIWWSKRGQSEGKWEFYSTKGRERLNIHVRVFNPPVRTDEIEGIAWRFLNTVMSTTTPKHTVVQSGREGVTFSITGVGISDDNKVLLASRFIVSDKKVVSAVHTIPVEAVSLDEYPAFERQRLAILKSLRMR